MSQSYSQQAPAAAPPPQGGDSSGIPGGVPSDADLGRGDDGGGEPDDHADTGGQDDGGAGDSGGDQGGDDPGGDSGDRRPRQVPQSALHQARQEAREAREHARLIEGRYQELQALVLGQRQQQGQGQAPQQQQPEPIPDVNVDPVGHFAAKAREAERIQHELMQRLQSVEQPIQQQAQRQAFISAYAQQAQAFAQQTPDWNDAYRFATDAMRRDAAVMFSTPEQMEEYLAGQAMRQGRNPAAAIYAYAQQRGYRPGQGGQDGGQGQQRAPDLQAVRDGRQVARSAGNSSEAPRGPGLSAERVLSMSVDEVAKIPDAQWRKLMGG